MRLSPEVISVLDRSQIEGNALALPQTQLERGLYLAVNKILEALGGKWNKKERIHLFDEDPADAIADAIIAGSVEDRRKAMQFFKTPDDLAASIVNLAKIKKGNIVLEPSAGDGAIVRAIRAIHSRNVIVKAVEIDKGWRDPLARCADDVLIEDFLGLDGTTFDVIVANPPFSKQQDIDHVLHMHSLLKPGGRLVSIMSSGAMDRQFRKASKFRDFVTENHGTLKRLPEGSFKTSGTMVNTCVVEIPKAA